MIEELKELHVNINLYNMELKLASMPVIKKVTSVSTIQDILNAKAVSKAPLPKLLLLLSTYAMSFAIAESHVLTRLMALNVLSGKGHSVP